MAHTYRVFMHRTNKLATVSLYELNFPRVAIARQLGRLREREFWTHLACFGRSDVRNVHRRRAMHSTLNIRPL